MRRVALVAMLVATARHASGYPSAVIYAPSARVLPAGSDTSFAAEIVTLGDTAAQSFIGTQLGLTDGFAALEHRWLAFEAGVDVVFDGAPWRLETTLLANAKLQIIDELHAAPAVAVGLFQVSTRRSANAALAYVAATKQLGSVGELTVGFMRSFASPGERAFVGSAPFRDGRYGFELGWSSPAWGRWSIAADLVSGTSQASGANVAVACTLDRWLHPFLAFSASVDRRAALAPSESVLAGVSIDFHLW